jgi:hypothetical protein
MAQKETKISRLRRLPTAQNTRAFRLMPGKAQKGFNQND